jgi:two-component system chemotaxis response regulator CheY
MVRALVVDDSFSLRKSLVLALKRIDGISCVEAQDGAEGLKRLNQHQFNIVITDINMPVMDGLKLISAVRADPNHAGIPIVVISTEADEKDRERAMALGANRYMVKPIQAPEVIAAVKELLKLA